MGLKARLVVMLLFVALTTALNQTQANAAASFVITTFAGTGSGGYSGDGGAATSAQIGSINLIRFDSSGNLYLADAWGPVRKITPGGTISTFAGTNSNSYSGDGGLATSAQLNSPSGTTTDSSGNTYIADYNNNRIRKVTPAGIISTFAGTGTAGLSGDGGAATSAKISNPSAVAVDSSGNLYIADYGNGRIRKVDSAGIITTVVGTTNGFSGDSGAATSAQLNLPNDVVFDTTGNMYIADYGNSRIRKVNTSGIISTVAGNGSTTFAGDGGAATSAALDHPQGMAVDTAGNLWIADTNHNRIRQVDTSGNISTVVGTGTASSTGDSGDAAAATINYPIGVAIDTSGNLYISEGHGYLIRKVANIAPASNTTTVSATIDPFFTFSVAGQGSTCNGDTNWITGVANATTVPIGHMAVSNIFSAGQALTVASNAGNGFSVYVRGTQASQNLRSTNHNFTDVTGTYASPAAVGSGERFGYTYKDSTTSTSVTNPGSGLLAALTNATTNKIMGSSSSLSGTGCIGYDVQTSSNTPAGSYTATILYTAVPAY